MARPRSAPHLSPVTGQRGVFRPGAASASSGDSFSRTLRVSRISSSGDTTEQLRNGPGAPARNIPSTWVVCGEEGVRRSARPRDSSAARLSHGRPRAAVRGRQPRRPGLTWATCPAAETESYLVDPASSICLSQRLSHACLSTNGLYSETAKGSLNQLWFL